MYIHIHILHIFNISLISDSYFSFCTMVFVEEIFLGIILALLMDGLQFLPPLLEKLMERKVVLASTLAWKMAATGLLPKVVQVGARWGVRVGSDR